MALLIVGSSISINASDKLSEYIYSHDATAGSWYSGYDDNEFYRLTTSYKEVYGGNVGMYFYGTSIGMPKAFVKSTSREIVFQLKEEDPGNDENELVRTYVGHFGTRTNGTYQPVCIVKHYVNDECIENNSTVELYYRMYVGKVSGDTTRYVPSCIARFKYWIET